MTTHSNAASSATEQPGASALSTTFLKPDEAQILLDWARSEDAMVAGAASPARIRAIVKEIDDLVGNRLDLVADDLEERMIALLVGDLDPKSQTCLDISRDVAQVTAEKDHLEGAELVRRLTVISSHTLRLTAGATGAAPSAAAPSGSAPASSLAAPAASATNPPIAAPVAARARPIPRPTKYPPRKPTLLQRLLGRK